MRFVAGSIALMCAGMFLLQLVIGTEYVVLDKALLFTQPWRLLTALFAHADITHLLLNLLALLVFGLVLEGVIGPRRTLILFLAAGIVINVFSPYQRALGASGAIYALIGSLVVLRPRMTVWLVGIPMPMAIAGLVYLIQDTIGVFTPSTVGNLAHIAGLFIGLGVGLFWRKRFGDTSPHPSTQYDPDLEQQINQWHKEYMNNRR